MNSDRPPVSEARSRAIRLAVFYAAIFLLLGLYMPYLPIWLAWRGLTPAEIGTVTAIPLFLRIIGTPLITFFADRHGDHRHALLAGCCAVCVGVVLLSGTHSFLAILVCVAVFQVINQSLLPLTEAKTLSEVRTYQFDYGRIRLWGSISFIAANLLGGVVLAQFGARGVMQFIIFAALLVVVAAWFLPSRPTRLPNTPAKTDASGRAQTIRLSDLVALLRQRWFIILMVASGAIQASHAVFYAFSALHWRSIGISEAWIGGLWALGVAAEVVLFAFSSRALARLGAGRLILLGGCAAVVRWSVMPLNTNFGVLIGLQLLHAFSFGATFIGALTFLQSRVPETQAGSAQGLHAALATGIVMGVATLLAGQLYEWYGAGSYFSMAVLAGIGVLAAALLEGNRPTPRANGEGSP